MAADEERIGRIIIWIIDEKIGQRIVDVGMMIATTQRPDILGLGGQKTLIGEAGIFGS